MRLSVIIINYKTGGLVLDCLASLYEFDTGNMEIIVVDNDSGDHISEIMQEKFPGIIFIQMGYNAGFARANNAGILEAKGANILLLNSDTVNLHDAVNKCEAMLSASSYVAAGVQLLNADGSPQISGNYAMKGGLNYLLPLPYLGRLFKGIAGLMKVKKPSIEKASGTTEVDWINGAFLMLKKNVIETAGLLDEDFFLYAEEAEWCSRIKKAGKLCIFGELNVLHLQGASANDAFGSEGQGYFNLFDRKGLQIMLSNFVRIRKQFGTGWFLFDILVYYFAAPVFFVGIFFSWIYFPKSRRYTFSQAKGYAGNMRRLFAYIPRIIKNRPFFYKVL